jgi:hypothetical protein
MRHSNILIELFQVIIHHISASIFNSSLTETGLQTLFRTLKQQLCQFFFLHKVSTKFVGQRGRGEPGHFVR